VSFTSKGTRKRVPKKGERARRGGEWVASPPGLPSPPVPLGWGWFSPLVSRSRALSAPLPRSHYHLSLLSSASYRLDHGRRVGFFHQVSSPLCIFYYRLCPISSGFREFSVVLNVCVCDVKSLAGALGWGIILKGCGGMLFDSTPSLNPPNKLEYVRGMKLLSYS
jgi:hypothetical protein